MEGRDNRREEHAFSHTYSSDVLKGGRCPMYERECPINAWPLKQCPSIMKGWWEGGELRMGGREHVCSMSFFNFLQCMH